MNRPKRSAHLLLSALAKNSLINRDKAGITIANTKTGFLRIEFLEIDSDKIPKHVLIFIKALDFSQRRAFAWLISSNKMRVWTMAVSDCWKLARSGR